MIQGLRNKIPLEEFDYQTLMGALSDYARPRDKVTALLAKGVIIRVKKGLYIFGPDDRKRPYSREILANLLYGPSCVSCDYALFWHSLIPERVETLTSVTSKRNKTFTTPVGVFSYHALPPASLSIGMQRVELSDGSAFLLASTEKALADKLYCERGLQLNSQKECLEYIVDSLRIDKSLLQKFDLALLEKLAVAYRSRRVKLLAGGLRRLIHREMS
ncbi:MAG: hypothetical protein PF441_06735 [Desulfuromusa sp.]|jgi:hypothetical protein|nr:hypothetical protein [Desulfuromusa sp.]